MSSEKDQARIFNYAIALICAQYPEGEPFAELIMNQQREEDERDYMQVNKLLGSDKE